jgi:hypothetical protein
MHIEPPKSRTLKEFGGEYLMIVVSILTALLLEYMAETVHHTHRVHEASARMDAELRQNGRNITQVLAHNEDKLASLKKVREQMLEDMQHHVGDSAWMARLQREWGKQIELSIHDPTLRREAWETAVADQSLSWMARDELERYAWIYSEMRETATVLNGSGNQFLDGPRMLDVLSDAQMGEGEPKMAFRMVNQMISAYSSDDGNLQNLKANLDQAIAALHAAA